MAARLFFSVFICIGTASFPSLAFSKTVHYDLTVTQQSVNLSGKKSVDFALAVNGTIPAPTLEFTEGDDAEITVTNHIASGEELSIHWHGILLPPEEDGVSYVNTPPILAQASRTFRFKIRQNGTYWYHSHAMLQEQKGVYGAIVIRPKTETLKYDRDAVVVISDWSDENADSILKNLKKDGDYYIYKKDSVRSYAGAIAAGKLKDFLGNEWGRMGGMDFSDVGYDAFLINGRGGNGTPYQLVDAKPGERIRLRIINAGASSYFNVAIGQAPMQVVSADGIDVQPISTNEILMGMAETYDVIFTAEKGKNVELRATAQDGSGSASAWIGSPAGEKVSAPVKPHPDLYAKMDHASHGAEHGTSHESGHDMHMHHAAAAAPVFPILTVDDLKAKTKTTLPSKKLHEVKLVLDGDMERYVWHINDKVMNEDRTILIEKGDTVRFTFQNESMMHHPMHLHGHFFRVLNKNGEESPLKHTVDVSPHSTRTIEFYADEPGQWMLHCHNLYHMKTGMARVVQYSDWKPSPAISAMSGHDPHMHDHWYYYGSTELASNHAEASFRASQTWNQLEARFESNNIEGHQFLPTDKPISEEWDFEADLFYRRWFGQYLSAIAGGTNYENKSHLVAGVSYMLPFLIETELIVNHEGKFRLGLERRFQWTKTILSDVEFKWRPDQGSDHEAEYNASLMYSPAWNWAAGLTLTTYSVGAGAKIQF